MVGPYRSASYFDLHLEIDTKGKLNTKLYDKRDDFNFPIINFPFLSSNIPSAPAYGVYVSQLICYSRACGEYHYVLFDRASRLTRKLQKQGYVAPRLLSSLNKFYGRHHVLVDRYEISVSDGYWFGFFVELLGFLSPYRTWLPPDWPRPTRRVLQQTGIADSSGAPGFTLIWSRVRLTRVCLYFMYFVLCVFLLFVVQLFPGFV
jgi:hypothetical protein